MWYEGKDEYLEEKTDVILSMPNLSCREKMVYLIIAFYADEKNKSSPSYATIMKKTGIKSRTTVIKAIRNIEKVGLLKKYNTQNEDGGRGNNSYELL